MHKHMICRISCYGTGILLLAVGITLATRTGLGISPLISIAYAVSVVTGANFAAMTFLLYSSFVAIQFLLRGRNCRLRDLLQLPFSLCFSFLLNIFSILIPEQPYTPAGQFLLLFAAIILTGVGAAAIVDMRLVANPADSLAGTVGEITGKGMGFGKNLIDCLAVLITLLIGLIMAGKPVGIGIGTVLSMIFIGRVVALFNRLLKARLEKAAGLSLR